MKWLRIIIISVLIGAVLPIAITPATPAMAATTADVIVTATPNWITAFTVTHISDTNIKIEWTVPATANVSIRAKYGSYPEEPAIGSEPTDGYLVFSGNATEVYDTSMYLDGSLVGLYYRIWAYTPAFDKWSTYFGQDYVEGEGMIEIAEQLNNFSSSFYVFLVFIPLIFFSIIAFRSDNRWVASVMFMLSAGIGILVGFYLYDLSSTPWMFGVSLLFWAYSTACLIFGMVCLFKGREVV